MLRATLGKTTFYKSYEGMRSKKHAMWSKKLYKIKEKRKVTGRQKYKVAGKWWFSSELLLCEEDIVTLRGPDKKKPKAKKASKPKAPAGPRKARVRKVAKPVAPPKAVRRSSRLRKKAKVDYSGM